MKKYLLLIVVIILAGCAESKVPVPEKPRTIITTDGEVDDMDSFIRMLLYSNEFKIEGLVYTSSMWHYFGDGKGTLFTSEMPMTEKIYGQKTDLRWTGTTWMEALIDKYALIYQNLIKHDNFYPAPEYLKSIIRIGNIEFEGEMTKDTEGSDIIKSILMDDKPGPVYLQAWGGTNTIARALKSIEDRYKGSEEWEHMYRKVSGKAVLYIILDQDATYKKYVAVNWPDIKVIYNSSQFGSLAYWWYRVVPKELVSFLSGEWFAENIRFNHGPLLEAYFLWGDGRKVEGDPDHTHGDLKEAERQKRTQYDFISEGDSPAYLYLIDFGLRSMENPSYGGLGGRFIQSAVIPSRWEDGRNVTDFNPYTGKPDPSPVVKIKHSCDLSAKPGEKIRLSGTATDPEGNKLKYQWWQYREAGTFNKDVTIEKADRKTTSVIIPPTAEKGKTIHMILEVTDDGTPCLTRYQRVIITVI
jgi:hypothetical protein